MREPWYTSKGRNERRAEAGTPDPRRPNTPVEETVEQDVDGADDEQNETAREHTDAPVERPARTKRKDGKR